MKEAQAEQQSQSQRQVWHINLCQSAPTATPNAPTRPRNWHSKKEIPARAMLGSLSQQLEEPREAAQTPICPFSHTTSASTASQWGFARAVGWFWGHEPMFWQGYNPKGEC